ncbi:hypothetical protein M23134_03965 [Microscilla marina ATCC 23134]|uniref:Uncharacterized protein n=1 Tax=Microscilla marina ATCC 23134 TaxID=313606 RepID=A1ZMN3_MICM2|nr:hypothetical protein M23134_03965 [Microscilla marina ATCC 23134]
MNIMAEYSLDDIIKSFFSGQIEEQGVKAYFRARGADG